MRYELILVLMFVLSSALAGCTEVEKSEVEKYTLIVDCEEYPDAPECEDDSGNETSNDTEENSSNSTNVVYPQLSPSQHMDETRLCDFTC